MNMKDAMQRYNEELEKAGMLSPRQTAKLLSILPPEILKQIGAIPNEPCKEQRLDTAGSNRPGTPGAGEDTDHVTGI